MDFVRSKFGTNEPLPDELFFPNFLVGLCAKQTSQKVRKKVFNWQRYICTKVTSYKIHILEETQLEYLINCVWCPVPVTSFQLWLKNDDARF